MKQNTPEWLEFRRNKIGASDAPIIMENSPWKTPYQLWEEKVFGKQTEQTSAMARGHALEDAARLEFEKMTGVAVMPKVAIHPVREWQMASIDGISFDDEVFVEIKCPSEETHNKVKQTKKIPDHYMTQMQHQLSVLEMKKGYYFSFDGKEGVIVPIERDDDYIAEMLEKEEEFYKLVKNKDSPPLSAKDYVYHEDLAWINLAASWDTINREMKILEERKEELRKAIIERADNRNCKGGGIRVTRSIPKGQVNWEEVCKIYNIDPEVYRKPSSERWTISACK